VSETCLYQMANSCTLALFEAGTADTEPSTAEYRRLTYRKCFQKKQVNQDEPCTDIQQDENVCTMYRQVCNMYIPTTHTYIQIKMQISLFIQSSDKVYTRTHSIFIPVSVHTSLEPVQTLYIPSTYIECTSLCLYVHRTQKQKVAYISGFKLTTLCILMTCLNH